MHVSRSLPLLVVWIEVLPQAVLEKTDRVTTFVGSVD